MQSPFHLNSGNIPPNTSIYSLVGTSQQDFHPEDGWELIQRDFGTQNDPVQTASFTIYNRYEGVIRTLTYVTNASDNFNLATSSTSLGYQPTGFPDGNMLMAFANSPTKSLSTYEPNTSDGFTLLNELETGSFGTGSGTWVISEAPVMYDPCVCDYRSIIQNKVYAQGITSITLEGTSTGSSEAVYSAGVSQSPFLAGASQADNFGKYFKVFKDAGALKTDAAAKGLKVFGAISSYFSVTGASLKILDFLVGGGKGSPPSLIGYRSEFEYDFTGQLQFQTSSGTSGFYTPGSDQTGLNPSAQPVYNNPLGVIALITPPSILRSTIDNSTSDGRSRGREIKYRFNSASFFYDINKDAGIQYEPVSIRAAIKFTSCGGGSDQPFPMLNSSGEEILIVDDADPTVFTTPFMDLTCLDDYTVTFVDRVIYLGAPTDNLNIYRDIRNCDGDMEVIVQFLLMPENAQPGQDPIEIMLTLEPDVIDTSNGSSMPQNDYNSLNEATSCSGLPILPLLGFTNFIPRAQIQSNFCSSSSYTPAITPSARLNPNNPERTFLDKLLDYTETINSTSTQKTEAIDVSAYPNPATSNVWLIIPERFADVGDNIIISILDVNGRLINEIESAFIGNKERIDLGSHPSGNYIITTHNTTKNKRAVSKITKR